MPKKQKTDSEAKILNQTIIISPPSNDSNLVPSVHTETETNTSYSVLCSKNQIKEPQPKEVDLKPGIGEANNSVTYEMMIEKMILEDDVECLSPKLCVVTSSKANKIESRESTELIKIKDEYSPHKKQPLLEPDGTIADSTQVKRSNNYSEILNTNYIENESNSKKEVMLESSLLNKDKSKDEYKIHLSCESLNFTSDIIIRNSAEEKKSSFVCGTCGKALVQKQQLIFNIKKNFSLHLFLVYITIMLTHSEERPFSCKHCGKTFRNKSSHKLHELRHTKNKPFKCDECKNSFVCLKELKTHQLVHKDEFPYVCAICSKEFRHANALKSHIRIHTGEKPYVCTHCPKKYAQLTSLTTHHNRHTDKGLSIKEINECMYCKRFLSKMKQNQHSKF